MKKFAEEKGDWFLQFVQDLPALAWAKDMDGRYIYVNAATVQAFGRAADAILGQSDAELFSQETAEVFRKNDQSALELGRRLQTVEVLHDAKGNPRYSLVTKFPIKDGDGTTYVAGTAIDITEQHTVYAQQEFLFQISEMIRTAGDADALMRDITAALGGFVKVDRCLFNEIDLKADREIVVSEFDTVGRSVIGEHRVSAYSPETTALMRSGKTVVNRDSKVDDRTTPYFESVYEPAGERSYVAVPMIRDGQWVGSLWCSSVTTRNWTDQDVQLIEAVAERTWAAVERLRTETSLRQYAERNSLLLELGDLTRNVSDPNEIQKIASDLLGKYLGVSRVAYAEIEGDEAVLRGGYNKGVEPLPERLKYATFGSELVELWKAGEMVVVHDVDADERFDESERANFGRSEIRALVTTTLIKNGKWVAGFSVQNASSRRWSGFEVDLVRDVAERTWDSVERARSESIATRAQRTFFDLVEQAPFGVYIVDSELTVAMVNHGSQEGAFKNVRPLIGRVLEEVMQIIWPADVAADILTRFRHTLETGAPFYSKEFINPREDIERTESYEWELHRIVLPDGSLGVVCYYFDSTRLRAAEMALRESEARVRASETQLRLITDSLPALVSYIGNDGTYKFVNRRYTDWFGVPQENILGRHMKDILGSAALEKLEPYIRKVLSGEQADFETWLNYKAAGERYVHVAYVPDTGPDNKVRGYYALVSDFTEHRHSEDLLRMSEERMKVLTDSFTDYSILSVDPNGLIDSWNPGAVNIFGYSDSEIIGRPIDELFTPEDRSAGVPQQEMKKAAQFGRALDERWHLRKDGSRFYASGVMAPLYIAGNLTGYAKIATDLTEKRRQAEELQRAYEEMELRVRERTQELASANDSLLEQINERRSAERQRITLLQRIVTTQEDERRRIARDLHDQLGQRLTALRLKLSSLGDLCDGEPELNSRVLRLQQIAGLLDSEVSFLTWQLRPQALDELGLAPALQTFVGEWSRHYNKPLDFHNSGVEGLRLNPEVESQVYRITQEALNNVVKHADAERVSVILERIDQALILIVEDDGIGFEADSPPRGPDPRLHGMGLAGMKERAALIGGELEIESERGRGTTIYLRVPIIDVTAVSLNT